jgi:hypothetical protein
MSIRLQQRARARDRSLTAGRKLGRRDYVRSTGARRPRPVENRKSNASCYPGYAGLHFVDHDVATSEAAHADFPRQFGPAFSRRCAESLFLSRSPACAIAFLSRRALERPAQTHHGGHSHRRPSPSKEEIE